MDSVGILIAGGGPAGSSCAWALRQAGLDPLILDKRVFPRDKICGGWITPAVLDALKIDPADYSRSRIFQPISGFRTSSMGRKEIETQYGGPISFGIRRFEFDEYLLRRSHARVKEGIALKSIERSGDDWIVNGEYKARVVVGAGGHFCPVARFLNSDVEKNPAVVAQELEFQMDTRQRDSCSIRADVPELFFCDDMQGYGWCFRKDNFLNIGLGRLDSHGLPGHVAAFARFLRTTGKIGFDLPPSFPGHAYLLHAHIRRRVVSDGILLVGDAAGLAYSQSGEGIRPAVESGLLAARTIISAGGRSDRHSLETYPLALESRFGESGEDWSTRIGRRLPPPVRNGLAGALLTSRWFSRHFVLDRWFLHRQERALEV
ncbi:MAG TPA: NAD(P)/FAD-dependent oxidoreductase [Candidatus Acidoferrum sp.]|nr:NAD(P)/FAD-dependent oxidoreductase [Candidatus Acidoferrum sp.]